MATASILSMTFDAAGKTGTLRLELPVGGTWTTPTVDATKSLYFTVGGQSVEAVAYGSLTIDSPISEGEIVNVPVTFDGHVYAGETATVTGAASLVVDGGTHSSGAFSSAASVNNSTKTQGSALSRRVYQPHLQIVNPIRKTILPAAYGGFQEGSYFVGCVVVEEWCGTASVKIKAWSDASCTTPASVTWSDGAVASERVISAAQMVDVFGHGHTDGKRKVPAWGAAIDPSALPTWTRTTALAVVPHRYFTFEATGRDGTVVDFNGVLTTIGVCRLPTNANIKWLDPKAVIAVSGSSGTLTHREELTQAVTGAKAIYEHTDGSIVYLSDVRGSPNNSDDWVGASGSVTPVNTPTNLGIDDTDPAAGTFARPYKSLPYAMNKTCVASASTSSLNSGLADIIVVKSGVDADRGYTGVTRQTFYTWLRGSNVTVAFDFADTSGRTYEFRRTINNADPDAGKCFDHITFHGRDSQGRRRIDFTLEQLAYGVYNGGVNTNLGVSRWGVPLGNNSTSAVGSPGSNFVEPFQGDILFIQNNGANTITLTNLSCAANGGNTSVQSGNWINQNTAMGGTWTPGEPSTWSGSYVLAPGAVAKINLKAGDVNTATSPRTAGKLDIRLTITYDETSVGTGITHVIDFKTYVQNRAIIGNANGTSGNPEGILSLEFCGVRFDGKAPAFSGLYFSWPAGSSGSTNSGVAFEDVRFENCAKPFTLTGNSATVQARHFTAINIEQTNGAGSATLGVGASELLFCDWALWANANGARSVVGEDGGGAAGHMMTVNYSSSFVAWGSVPRRLMIVGLDSWDNANGSGFATTYPVLQVAGVLDLSLVNSTFHTSTGAQVPIYTNGSSKSFNNVQIVHCTYICRVSDDLQGIVFLTTGNTYRRIMVRNSIFPRINVSPSSTQAVIQGNGKAFDFNGNIVRSDLATDLTMTNAYTVSGTSNFQSALSLSSIASGDPTPAAGSVLFDLDKRGVPSAFPFDRFGNPRSASPLVGAYEVAAIAAGGRRRSLVPVYAAIVEEERAS